MGEKFFAAMAWAILIALVVAVIALRLAVWVFGPIRLPQGRRPARLHGRVG